MHYNPEPTLQHLAEVNTAQYLYNDFEIRSFIIDEMFLQIRSNREKDDAWILVEIKIVEKFYSLLPSSIQNRLAKVLRFMFHGICTWVMDHTFVMEQTDACQLLFIQFNCFCWKTDGTINRTQTAKNIALNDNIDPNTRFIIACTYFLETEVLTLWEKHKDCITKKNVTLIGTNASVRFWLKWLKKEDDKKWVEMVDGYFKIPRLRLTDVPIRISSFYDYLSSESKQSYITHLSTRQAHFDDFRLCLNKMQVAERVRIIRCRPIAALFPCLEWPFRSILTKIAKEVFDYLTIPMFENYFYCLFTTYFDGYEDFEVLEEFWQMSPAVFKYEVRGSKELIFNIEMILQNENHHQKLENIVRKLLRIDVAGYGS